MDQEHPGTKKRHAEDEVQASSAAPTTAVHRAKKEKVEDEATKGGWVMVDSSDSGTSGATDNGAKVTVCAKWCQIRENGTVKLDRDLKCALSYVERKDPNVLWPLIHGLVVTERLHPLIFESAGEGGCETVRLRSLQFLEELVADAADGVPDKYQSLSTEEKRIVGVGVRDLFLSSWARLSNEREKGILQGMIGILDAAESCIQIEGMNASFCPTASHKLVKFIEIPDDLLEKDYEPLFAVMRNTPKLRTVFVDPAELSYHNFENIIPLDRWVELKLGREGNGTSSKLSDIQQLTPDCEVWTGKLQGATSDLIKQLPSLDLYVEPLNKDTRGGGRFIFHSAQLSKALSDTVRSSGLLDMLANGELASSFEFVNYVFRCNKFAPGDGIFSNHRDTPYYDGVRSHVSKYTLIIYLTSGRGEPALRVNGVNLNDIEEMECVIFDQRYEHEGKPFTTTDKIFLRTELVFKDTNLRSDSKIASLFSRACYLTGQSVFQKELSSYAHECFERANSLHWGIKGEETKPTIYLHKRFHDISFMTDGYNYWFHKKNLLRAQDGSMIAVLDYFNCKVDGKPFRSLCTTTTVQNLETAKDIWAHQEANSMEHPDPYSWQSGGDATSLIRYRPDKPFVKRPRPSWWPEDIDTDESEEEGEGEGESKFRNKACCPFHCYRTFDAWEDRDVRQEYDKICDYVCKKLYEGPLLFLNQKLVINRSNIKVIGDKVYFVKRSGSNAPSIPPINFAACWNDFGVDEFVGVKKEISAPGLLIPPVLFHKFDEGYHFVLDFFRNDWMVQVDDERKVYIPTLTNELPESPREPEESFWSKLREQSPA